MYLLFISVSFFFVYILLFFFYPYFFEARLPRFRTRLLGSAFLVVVASLLAQQMSEAVPDPFWSGRVLHFLGGGIVASLASFLAARDSGVALGRARFFFVSYLVVTTLGVWNEHAELFLQGVFKTSFSVTPLDTWLDLLSNTLGTLAGVLILLPFWRGKREQP